MIYKLNLQRFASGVFPVHNNLFKIAVDGRDGAQMETIKEMETFGLTIDGNVEEWSPMEEAGWVKRAVTGKSLSISLSGKRHYGDAGNDYIFNTILDTGQDLESILEWTLPDGSKLEMACIINMTAPSGGDSTNIDILEVELLSNGKPTFTPATP